MKRQKQKTAVWHFFMVFALVLAMLPGLAAAKIPVEPIDGHDPGGPIGTGDGRIHIIPSLSSPSVKNGETVKIQALVKASSGVAKVYATIRRESGTDSSAPVAHLVMNPAEANLGGSNMDGTPGIWQAEWTAAGLEKTYYTVAVTVTDRTGHEFTDPTLRFSDPIAGRDEIGTSDYPDGGMSRIDAADDFRFEGYLTSAVVDTVNGYAYFGGMDRVVKIALGNGSEPPSRIASVKMEPGEDNLESAVIDPSAGYAYFGTGTTPGRIIKIALGNGAEPPTRIGALTLNAGENNLTSAVIDASAGFAYFGTRTYPGCIVKIALGNATDPPTRIGAVTLNTGEQLLTSAVIDPSAGFAFFGTLTSPGQVVKIALGNGSNPPTRIGAVTLNTGEELLTSAVIDPSAGFAYFGTETSPGQVIKVAMGNGANPPTRIGAVILDSPNERLTSAVIDPAAGYAYFGTDTSPGRVVKIALGNNTDPPTWIGELQLGPAEEHLMCAVFDPGDGLAYFGTHTIAGQVIKIDTGEGMDPPVRIGAVVLDSGEGNFRSAAIDVSDGYAYLGTMYGRVVKVSLGNGSDSPARTGSLELSKDYSVDCGVIDTAAGFGYFGVNTYPAQVIKVDLGNGSDPPIQIGSAILTSDETPIYNAVIDVSAGYAYFGIGTVPGQIVKIALGNGTDPPTRVGSLTLDPGEDYLSSAVIDPSGGYAYFGTGTVPGRVVKIALGEGADPPTRVGSLILDPGEDELYSAVIDPDNGYAYYGVYTRDIQGKVVKVAIGNGPEPPTRIGAVTLYGAENRLSCAIIDPADGYAYFGTRLSPGRIVKISLGEGTNPPTRVGTIAMGEGENDLLCGVIDPVHDYAYFGTSTQNGIMIRVGLSQIGFIKGTRFTMPEDGTLSEARFYSHAASGSLRLAIYDSATPPNRLWQSDPIVNTAAEDWIAEPIANGTPSSLQLTAGNYWFAWQVDTAMPVSSYAWGTAGDGFYVPQSWGEFPAVLDPETGISLTDDIWSGYVTYDAACLSTGVTISMPSMMFRAGDPCNCRVSVCNAETHILNGYPLFVILDVFGDYFFAPSFNQIFDDYLEQYPQFAIGETFVTVLPDFAWPDNVNAVNGVIWYAALTDPSMSQIIGEWDQWEFGWE